MQGKAAAVKKDAGGSSSAAAAVAAATSVVDEQEMNSLLSQYQPVPVNNTATQTAGH